METDMGLALIANEANWSIYKLSLEAENQIEGIAVWGTGPKMYPCLVASLLVENRFKNCYVYVEDAAALLDENERQNIAEFGEPDPPSLHTINTVGPTQDQFNRHASAMLMAILDEMIEVKMTNPERFETVLARCTSRVDQFTAEQHEGFHPAIVDLLMGLEDGKRVDE